MEDLRSVQDIERNGAAALQDDGVYLVFMIVYAILSGIVTYLIITLYRINDMKKLASVIIYCISIQIYSHLIQFTYFSFADLESIPLGITYAIWALPLLCHFWVCSLLILHWMKIFECSINC